MQDFSRLCGEPRRRERERLFRQRPLSARHPDHLQHTLLEPRSRSLPGLGGKTEAARCAHFRWERVHWVTESRELPDLILGHEVHALGCSRADRFLCHGAWGLRTSPRAQALGSASQVSWETGCWATRDAEAEPGPHLERFGQPDSPLQASGLLRTTSVHRHAFRALPAHLLCPGLPQPSSAENLGETSRPYTPSSF